MKVFVVLCIIPDWNGEINTVDSVFSSEKLAKSRVEEMSKVRPDLFWDYEEYIIDDLITKGD